MLGPLTGITRSMGCTPWTRGSVCVWGGGGVMSTSAAGGMRVTGPPTTTIQLFVDEAAAMFGRPESCVMTPLMLLCSLGLWLSCCGNGAGNTDIAASNMLVLSPLCVQVHLPLEVRACLVASLMSDSL